MDNSTPPKNMMDLAPSLKTPGFRLVDAGELYALLNSLFSIQQGIVARGTTQATGFKLTAAINNVTTVTAPNNALVLPPGLPGRQVTVSNNTATAAAVFASGADQIIPINSATPASTEALAGGTTAIFVCVSQTFNPTVATWKQVSVQ
jgi:hypothetical protein